MKILYFDIDGTILRDSRPKTALAEGVFEEGVRLAGFEQLVCVSSVVATTRFLESLGQKPDSLGIVFDICRGTIRDESWFRKVTTLVSDPANRAHFIDFTEDWWYLDDLASLFLEREGKTTQALPHWGRRIFAPEPDGDGTDVLDWLRSTSPPMADVTG